MFFLLRYNRAVERVPSIDVSGCFLALFRLDGCRHNVCLQMGFDMISWFSLNRSMRLMSALLRVHTLLALGSAEHCMAGDEKAACLLLEEGERQKFHHVHHKQCLLWYKSDTAYRTSLGRYLSRVVRL